jgi:peptide-methionine (S)-S-oxide reductase
MSTNKEIATLAAGCFWCVEAVFQQLKGVETVESGYTGGHVKNPSYKDVCSGETGHAEVIQISYDPTVITFNEILKVFFKVHDPTTLNRQGADVGTQYRSSIFYHNDTQKEIAEKNIAALNESGAYADKIVTLVEPLNDYYKAEDYHQNYFNDNGDKNPYCQMVVRPKVEKFEKAFAEMLK